MHATRRRLRRAATALALGLAAGPSGPPSRSSGSFFAAAQSSSSDASETSITQTHNYIDTISGYDELSTCAELVLSTVVRGEYSGCADTFAVTSYTCFCTDSSSYMSAVISSDVLSRCDSSYASSQAISALAVFSSYCALGVEAGLTTQQANGGSAITTSSPSSGTATPAASISTVTISASSTPTSSSSSSSTSSSSSSSGLSSTNTAVIIGVLVSLFGVLSVLAGWLIWRRHKRSLARLHAGPADDATTTTTTHDAPPPRKGVAEVAAVERPAEIAGPDEPRFEAPASHEVVAELPAGEARGPRSPQEMMAAEARSVR